MLHHSTSPPAARASQTHGLPFYEISEHPLFHRRHFKIVVVTIIERYLDDQDGAAGLIVERNGAGSTPGFSVRSTVKDGERTGPQQIARGAIAYEVKVSFFSNYQDDPGIVLHVRHALA